MLVDEQRDVSLQAKFFCSLVARSLRISGVDGFSDDKFVALEAVAFGRIGATSRLIGNLCVLFRKDRCTVMQLKDKHLEKFRGCHAVVLYDHDAFIRSHFSSSNAVAPETDPLDSEVDCAVAVAMTDNPVKFIESPAVLKNSGIQFQELAKKTR